MMPDDGCQMTGSCCSVCWGKSEAELAQMRADAGHRLHNPPPLASVGPTLLEQEAEGNLPKYLVYEDSRGRMVRRAIKFVPCDCTCHTGDYNLGNRDCLHCVRSGVGR